MWPSGVGGKSSILIPAGMDLFLVVLNSAESLASWNVQ